MEKEIWKWILNSFSDEGIVNIAKTLGIKIPGFRQLNSQQKNFNIIRPKIIQAALQQKFAKKLRKFFHSAIEKQTKVESLKEKSIEELLEILEEDMQPSFLLGMLLSCEDEESQEKAIQIYRKLKGEKKLDLLEQQADEKESSPEMEDVQDDETFKSLQEEMKSAQQTIEKLEKKLKNIEKKNEELKAKETKIQVALKNEKKRGKEEKNTLSHEIHSLKGEIGSLKHQVKSISSEKELLQNQMDKQTASINTKDEEIKRLNALTLKLRTDLEKLSNIQERSADVQGNQRDPKIKVALIGDPKNSRIQTYNKFELTVIEGTEIQEEETPIVLNNTDQIWMLTYKIPKSIQKRVRSLVTEKKIIEFPTFIDLENYMLKGMV